MRDSTGAPREKKGPSSENIQSELLQWGRPFTDLIDLLEPALVPGPFAAVAALPYSTSSFNSGVFVFEPSMATAAVLDDLSHRATFRPVRATTTGASDDYCCISEF